MHRQPIKATDSITLLKSYLQPGMTNSRVLYRSIMHQQPIEANNSIPPATRCDSGIQLKKGAIEGHKEYFSKDDCLQQNI